MSVASSEIQSVMSPPLHKSAIVLGPVVHAVLRLVLGVDSGVHAEKVAHWAERTAEIGGVGQSSLRFVHQRPYEDLYAYVDQMPPNTKPAYDMSLAPKQAAE